MIHTIEARDLPDLWFQAVNDIFEHGKEFTIDQGSYAGQKRLEYDYFVGFVYTPSWGSGTIEILPQIPSHFNIPNPVDLDYIYGGPNYSRSYIEYIMTDRLEPNESYTYGSRLRKYRIPHDVKVGLDYSSILFNEKILHRELGTETNRYEYYLDQIEYVIWHFKKFGHRTNQMVLQISQPSDLLLSDPPCWRHCFCRIQDNKLHFHIYFRSWCLFNGLPANLAGIEYLQKYMASEIGVEQGEFIVESSGLHLYDHVVELAKKRINRN